MRMGHKPRVTQPNRLEYSDVGNPVNQPGYIPGPTVKGLDVGDTGVNRGVGQFFTVGFAIRLMTPSLIKGKIAHLFPDVRVEGIEYEGGRFRLLVHGEAE